MAEERVFSGEKHFQERRIQERIFLRESIFRREAFSGEKNSREDFLESRAFKGVS